MTYKLDKYVLYKFSCCDEGRKLIGGNKNIDEFNVGGCVFHYFIIISPQEYSNNQKNNYVSAIPLSHSADNFTKQTYGLTLDSDDFEGVDPELRRSIILCDRPMRLCKNDLFGEGKPYGKIRYKALQKILIKIADNFSVKLQVKQ